MTNNDKISFKFDALIKESEYDQVVYFHDITLTKALIEAKILVDRWDDGITTFFVINSCYKMPIDKLCNLNFSHLKKENNIYYLYGAQIVFLNSLDKNEFVALSNRFITNGDLKGISKCIVNTVSDNFENG